MKKLLLIPVLLLMAMLSHSQFIHKIKADSVLITNDSCNAELNLENSTKDTLGFLYNKGKGRTEFRRALRKINDSLYIIGADTLNTAKGLNDAYIRNQNASAQTANAWISGSLAVGGRTLLGGAVDDGLTNLQVNGGGLFNKVVTSVGPVSGSGWPKYNFSAKQRDASRVVAYTFIDNNDNSIGALYMNPPYNRMGIENSKAGGYINLEIQGVIKFSTDANRTKIYNVLNIATSAAPTSSADATGSQGDLIRDAAGNLYLKTATGWLKFTGVTF